MSNEIIVSVVMITYNHERFIAQALDSIMMQQTDFQFEVVVGEDCSTDGTRNILEKYVKKYPDKIKPLYRDKNLGMSANVIDVMKHCAGKFLAFLEGDDIWTDKFKLQKQADFLRQHNDYYAVAHECDLIDQTGKQISPRLEIHDLVDGEYGIANLEKHETPGQTATIMIRNFGKGELEDLVKKIKWALIPLDRVLPILMLSKGKVYVFPEYMSSYRFYIEENGTNWSSSHDLFYKKTYFLHYFYANRSVAIGKKFNIHINLMEYKAELFVNAYRYAKGKKSIKCLLQCVGMFLIEIHKVSFYQKIMEYKRIHR